MHVPNVGHSNSAAFFFLACQNEQVEYAHVIGCKFERKFPLFHQSALAGPPHHCDFPVGTIYAFQGYRK